MPNNAQTVFNQMLPWLGALLALILVGGLLLFYLRHRLLGQASPGEVTRGILEDLREMRDRGEITAEEYEEVRLKMVARASGRDFGELKAESIRKAGGLVAEPGRDLLGRPLPTGAQAPESPGADDPGAPPKQGDNPQDLS
ncbi:MAG: SHOCT domain-containing protein [Phycisphaeraceae bacterium]|nr:MAG: SHOCT domain-containing protein [Phycisphaeraceae bacterium]